jgi:hypothetical protein
LGPVFTMHAINFLFWFLGAIKAGQVSVIERGSPTAITILEHIELVQEMNEYIDLRTKASIDMVFQIKGLVAFSGMTSANTNEICTQIELIIKDYLNGPRAAAAYFLQGAFELARIEDVRVYPALFDNFPASDLLEKLHFLFFINGQGYLTKEMTQNLKIYVDNIFIHVIDKVKLDEVIKKADNTPLPNGGRLKVIDQPVFPGKPDDKLEILC